MTIQEDIRAFVVDAFYAPLGLGDHVSLIDTGVIDSTGLLEMIAFIEENYAVRVADDDLKPENFGSIAKISMYVERRLRDLDENPASGPRTLPDVQASIETEHGGQASAVG